MASSITMSFSAPIELTIQIEEYLEVHGISRSELIQRSLSYYINLSIDQEKQIKKNEDLLEEVHKNILEIKSMLEKTEVLPR